MRFTPSLTGKWDTIATVMGSDATTTGQTLADAAGLSVPLLANHVYEFEAALLVLTSADANGTKYGVNFSGAGASVRAVVLGTTSVAAATAETINALATGTITPRLTGSGSTGVVMLNGFITTGANAGNFTVQHLKITSGTSTVKIGSSLKIRIAA